MSKIESKQLRNIALVGHGSTGKTSLAEAFLFISGKNDRLGRVDDGSSTMDFEPEEQKRKISVSSAVTFLEWDKNKINIVDTPGDQNFSFDTKNCLRVVDAAVVLVDAVGGVEYQTLKVWDYADEFKLPRVLYINRMDRERANFDTALASIRKHFNAKISPVFLPIGSEASFKGIVDLLEQTAYIFTDFKSTPKKTEIPPDMQAEVDKYRGILVEDIAEADEELMDRYLNDGELSLEDLKRGFRAAVIKGSLVPVACGSATKGIGVSLLLDMIVNYLPSPVDRPDIRGSMADQEATRLPDESSPFCALVFKTIADPYAGRLTLFRVYSGTLKPDSSFYNSSRRISERFGHAFYLEGKNQKTAEYLIPGDIAAVAKLKETTTGDTLCLEKAPIILPRQAPPAPVMSFAVEAKNRGDEDKIISSINRLIEEDPTLTLHRDNRTREMILS
ncbi:MAG: GTP-binding protein, partial [Smithellaceae bacterium]|nr:GTP-binding protein [Smithellaceae bacterium]